MQVQQIILYTGHGPFSHLFEPILQKFAGSLFQKDPSSGDANKKLVSDENKPGVKVLIVNLPRHPT